ncbi:MAG: hypothetical protein LUG18_07535 [Candidatus Azobacteroides sp.]|nr:hypothetical protein [Candidatus Azobacteroides sp.]
MGKGYNKKNKYKKIIRVQEEYMKYINSGYTTIYIYKNFIYPQFLISKATFYNYLAVPAQRDLKRIEKKKDDEEESKD